METTIIIVLLVLNMFIILTIGVVLFKTIPEIRDTLTIRGSNHYELLKCIEDQLDRQADIDKERHIAIYLMLSHVKADIENLKQEIDVYEKSNKHGTRKKKK